IALDYRKAISVSIDPIEKKPLYEFMPRTRTYSFATEGCNLHCPWCQNHEISQILPTQKIKGYDITPENHVQAALRYGTPSISYTYSEPTIFLEYALETMKLAKQEGLKNIWVSNGYMSKETMDEILPYTDAFNIDYKGTENVYHRYCGGHSQAVLDNLKRIKDNDIHLEVTTLLIPGINDSADQVEQIANELIQSIGKDFVWHLTRFHPQYKMTDRPITSRETMYVALKLARDKGIHSVYLGNI
ncbi:MAG: AmmeMemoRadiSam system radical SAM enzyme, partial [Bacilli bacterium]|nr:AmmeMemoRadiSam system radical SAM enzyme [Bacilli bacterium]MBN2877319.1 AmmeMemoRadiSam system radical SAM enzyme [Bacilli bacterium]